MEKKYHTKYYNRGISLDGVDKMIAESSESERNKCNYFEEKLRFEDLSPTTQGDLGIMGYLKVIAKLLYEMNERQKAKVEEETVNQGRFI